MQTREGEIDVRPRCKTKHIEFLERHPLATLAEARRSLLDAFPPLKIADISTVHRVLSEHSIFLIKRTHYENIAANSARIIRKWCDWCVENAAGINWTTAVFLDESGFNLATTRKVGRAPRGEGVIATRPAKGRNLCLLIAASQERGVFAQAVHFGRYNASLSLDFVEPAYVRCFALNFVLFA